MKRFLLTAILSAAAANPGWCTVETYTNKTYVTTVPLTPIDAINFLNLNVFSFSTTRPYDFSNVRNYTNRSIMSNAGSGFRFDTVPTTGGRFMAQNFYNASLAGNPSTNATVFAQYQLLINATNIVNRGLLSASSFGLIKMDGQNLDLSRGAFQIGNFGDRQSLYPEAVFDQAWGLGEVEFTPNFHVGSFFPNAPLSVFTPAYGVTRFFPSFIFLPYIQGLDSLFLFGFPANSVSSAQLIQQVGTNRSVQYVFLRNPNSNILTRIKFGPDPRFNPRPASPGVPIIEWQAAGPTNVLGQIFTNTLYLKDIFAVSSNTTLITNFPFAYQPPQSFPVQPASFQPTNFIVTRSTPFDFLFAPDADPFVMPPPSIWTTNAIPQRVTGSYSAYEFRLATTTTDPSQITPLSITNIRTGPGRIEMNARGKLDLNLARIESLNYLSLTATNHFAGASNATMSATYADLNLASTNGTLDTSGLLRSALPRLNGTVKCFSVKWENLVISAGETNPASFHLLYVDSDLQEYAAPQALNLSLRSTNAFIGSFEVIDNLFLDVDHLTIRSNGVVRLYKSGATWPGSAPHIVTFTNFGLLDYSVSYEELAFHSIDSYGESQPYGEFVNFGNIFSTGISISSTNVLNGGGISSSFGPATLQAVSDITLLPGGFISAPNADISISCRNLNVSNHSLILGRSLSLSVTESLNAGVNDWTVYDGFHLVSRPVTGDFLETSITDNGFAYAEVQHTWAGEDRGASAEGFTNNAALGQLVLDGGIDTLFTFNGTGPADNALYVDVLVLRNTATNRDEGGNFTALNVNPGMKIYFSQAFIDDGLSQTDITAELAGANGGSLVQVDHTGPLSQAKQMLSLSPALRVTIEKNPSLRSLVTWDTAPSATNYLYRIANPYASDWQLVTNFVSGPTGGPVTIVEPVNDNSRFYKVRVDVSAP